MRHDGGISRGTHELFFKTAIFIGHVIKEPGREVRFSASLVPHLAVAPVHVAGAAFRAIDPTHPSCFATEVLGEGGTSH